MNWWKRRTEYGDNLVVLNDLERAGHNETQRVDALALVEQHVTGRPMTDAEVDGERAQTAVTGESERRVFVENDAVEMHADVGAHVRRTVVQYLHNPPHNHLFNINK